MTSTHKSHTMTFPRPMAAIAAAIPLATAAHAAEIPFTLDKPGNVSAAIYDPQDPNKAR